MNRDTIQGVLFDLGDTLFSLATSDARRFLSPALQLSRDYLVAQGLKVRSADAYRRFMTRGVGWAVAVSLWTYREINVREMIARLHRRIGLKLTDEQIEQCVRRCYEPYRQIFLPEPDAKHTLEQVRAAGYPVGLVSNTFVPGEIIDEDLIAAGLFDLLDFRVYSCDVGYMKPDRRIFDAALERMALPANRVMFVGDMIDADIGGAGRLGMTTVLRALSGVLPAGPCRPDHVIRRVSEVLSLLPGCRGGAIGADHARVTDHTRIADHASA